MAVNPNQELIWRGRLHMGDEPGVYGDAAYTGLASELPVRVFRSNPENPYENPFKLILDTENLKTYDGYLGHKIIVTIYELEPATDPASRTKAIERVLATQRFEDKDNNHKEIDIIPPSVAGPFDISVRLRVDTTVPAGSYNDFVWVRLSLFSAHSEYYASFGFG